MAFGFFGKKQESAKPPRETANELATSVELKCQAARINEEKAQVKLKEFDAQDDKSSTNPLLLQAERLRREARTQQDEAKQSYKDLLDLANKSQGTADAEEISKLRDQAKNKLESLAELLPEATLELGASKFAK